jgi:hypothetical protein
MSDSRRVVPQSAPDDRGTLPPDAVVVRGGLMKAETMAHAAETYYRAYRGERGYGLSVWSLPGLTAEEIAIAIGSDRLPHNVMRQSTVGELQALGCEFTQTGDPAHWTMRLAGPPTDDDWDRVNLAFQSPQANPVAKGGEE